jgi:protein phosphatase
VLDDGKLVVAHAGMKEEMQGRGSGKVREFALYGETTGETDEFGLPVRYNWAAEYRGRGDGRLRPHAGARARVAQPHDQHRHRLRLRRQAHRAALPGAGARLGPGRADLLRAPGRSCPRGQQAPALSAQQQHDDVLDIDDVLGKRIISTRLRRQRHDPRGERRRRAGGDEPLRRDPKWLIYLPPTMSPSRRPAASRDLLEHPAEAFDYYRTRA